MPGKSWWKRISLLSVLGLAIVACPATGQGPVVVSQPQSSTYTEVVPVQDQVIYANAQPSPQPSASRGLFGWKKGCCGNNGNGQPQGKHSILWNFKDSLWGSGQCGCWSHPDQYGCSSFWSEFRFAFGNCRAWFGEPCRETAPIAPVPPGYDQPALPQRSGVVPHQGNAVGWSH